MPEEDDEDAISPINEEGEVSTETKKTTFIAEAFAGPLPSPADLAAYERVSPGLANTIADLAKEEQKHRHKCERTFTPWFIVDRFFGKTITLVALGMIAYATWIGERIIAILLAVLLGIPTLADFFVSLAEKISKR